MKRWRTVAGVAAGLVWALAAAAVAQEDPSGLDLDSFYGKQTFQTIALGVAPYILPEGGYGGQARFGFNTLSRRRQAGKHWKNYYGVSLDLFADQQVPYHFSQFGQVDLSSYGVSLMIESKLFYSDQGRVRPYLGLAGGGGFGGVNLGGLAHDVDPPKDPRLYMVQFGPELGIHFMLSERLALVISDVTSVKFGAVQQDQFFIFPSTIYVGITSWRSVAQERNEEW